MTETSVDQRTRWQDVRYIGLLVAIVAGVLLLLQMRHPGDVELCRQTFRGLATGDMAVRDRIDWDHLTALGISVYEKYVDLPSPQDREAFQKTFIIAFSKGFGGVGATVRDFGNWRVHARTAEAVTIAVDHRKQRKTLLMVVPASGEGKLVGLQWVE